MSRPILIDQADGPCEICADRVTANEKAGRRLCTRCGAGFLNYQNMGGNGFQSVKPHHYHLEPVEGTMGRRCVWDELCHECHVRDRQEAYPGIPVPALPLVVVDLNVKQDPRLFESPVGEYVE